MKNLTKTLMFITALGCIQQLLPMDGKNHKFYSPTTFVTIDNNNNYINDLIGDSKIIHTSCSYNDNIETVTFSDSKNNTYYFANIKQQTKTVAPISQKYPKLNLHFIGTITNPKFKADKKKRGSDQASEFISLYGTFVTKC